MDFLLMLFGTFLGGLLSIAAALLTEYFKLPKLSITLETNSQIWLYPKGKPARKAKFVHVVLWNKPPNKFQAFFNRIIKLSPAFRCHGEIQFFHQDNGSPVLQNPMRLRWANFDPISSFQIQKGQLVEVLELSKIEASYFRTCYPEKSETIDIAAKFGRSNDCYGWTTESVLARPAWKRPNLRLAKGRYLVQITVRSEDTEIHKIVELDNSSSIENFRILPASKDDEAKIKKRFSSI